MLENLSDQLKTNFKKRFLWSVPFGRQKSFKHIRSLENQIIYNNNNIKKKGKGVILKK